METFWKSWPDLRSIAAGRKLVLYGRSEDWVHKTLRKLPHAPAYIVDRNEAYQGQSYFGLPVELPSVLEKEEKDDIFVVITAGSYEGIVDFLERRGFVAGTHFCCSPTFYDFSFLERMRSHEQSVLVSSSDFLDTARARSSKTGGGLFKFTTGRNECVQVARGQFRQIERVGDHIFALDYVEMKLQVFDDGLDHAETFPLDRPNYCGLAYEPTRDVLVLVNSGSDTISIHERKTFKKLEEVYYSNKHLDGDEGVHHLNDVCVSGDYIYVSYFSHAGTFKKGIYDGGVSEIHIDRLDAPPVPTYSGLWMPHSPELIEDNICVLDSMRGRFHTDNQTIAGQFPGWIRGLAYDGRYYYIGQSENMYLSRLLGTNATVMLNAGIFIFDPATKACRFFQMTDSMNVHDLIIL